MSAPPDHPPGPHGARTRRPVHTAYTSTMPALPRPRPVRLAVNQQLDLEDEFGAYEPAEAQAGAPTAGDGLGRLVGAKRRRHARPELHRGVCPGPGAFDFRPGLDPYQPADYASNQICTCPSPGGSGSRSSAPDLPAGGVDPMPSKLWSMSRCWPRWVPTPTPVWCGMSSPRGEVPRRRGSLPGGCRRRSARFGGRRRDRLRRISRGEKFLRGPRRLPVRVGSSAGRRRAPSLRRCRRDLTDPTLRADPDAPVRVLEIAFALVLGLGAAR